MNDATSEDEMETLRARDDIAAMLYQAGFGHEMLQLSNKSTAVQLILQHQVLRSRNESIRHLREGLDNACLMDLLVVNNGCLSLIFPLSCEVMYDHRDLLECLEKEIVCNTPKEEQALLWFKDYIISLGKQHMVLLIYYYIIYLDTEGYHCIVHLCSKTVWLSMWCIG